jgi:hypothetical protein
LDEPGFYAILLIWVAVIGLGNSFGGPYAMSELFRADYSCFSYSVGHRRALSDVAGSGPGELDLHSFDVGTLSLCVDSFDHVTVDEDPLAGTLGLVLVEFALEVGAVRVDPLSSDELSVFVLANVLLAGLEDDVGALAFFVSVWPLTGVDIRINVRHDALSVTVAVLPVAVVISDANVLLLADAVLLVAVPLTAIGNGNLGVLGLLGGVSIDTLSLSDLN